MLGAIIGDIIGSRFEFNNTKDYDFELFHKDCSFTDDTICTIAIASAILTANDKPEESDYKNALQYWCRKYPNPMGAYGASFANWVSSSNPQPYNSFGNGAAMRVSPVGWAFEVREDVIRQAMMSAKVSHSHVEGMLGAAAVANAIVNFRYIKDRELINLVACKYYGSEWKNKIPKRGMFDETCQGCVPLAFDIVMNCNSFEDAIRKAISYGGDSDTLGAIVGSIAEPLFGIPAEFEEKALNYLTPSMIDVYNKFKKKYDRK